MDLHITQTKQKFHKNEIVIWQLSGAIDAKTVGIFEKRLDDLMEEQNQLVYLILNLRDIKYVNSTGLGTLVNFVDKVESNGGIAWLVEIHPKVKVVFDMLGLNAFFTIIATEKEALQRLGGVYVRPKNSSGALIGPNKSGRGSEKKVVLLGVDIEIRVEDIISKVKISQRYQNNEQNALETIYSFPLEAKVAVDSFGVTFDDGRKLQGKIESKEKAFTEYDEAMSSGDTAYLVEKTSDNAMMASIGNLKSGQQVEISVTYSKELSFVDGQITLQIPTSFTPLYGNTINSEENLALAFSVPHGLTITTFAHKSFAEKISSPSHKIELTDQEDQFVIALRQEEQALDRDFILELTPPAIHEPVCLVSKHDNGTRAMMLRLYPDLKMISSQTPPNYEVVFVLDCSGSMGGSSIVQAKKTLEVCLHSLSPGDYFNIFTFGTDFEKYKRKSIKYDNRSLKEAIKTIHTFDADMGGTRLKNVIEEVCHLPQLPNVSRNVILLTDGAIRNTQEVVEIARLHRENLRIFTFGIGHRACENLASGLAEATNGTWEMISPQQAIWDKVLRQFARIDQPRVENLQINCKKLQLEDYKLPCLYEGDSFTVFARIAKGRIPKKIELTGNVDQQTLAWSVPIKNLKKDNTIPNLWAINHIHSLKNLPKTSGSNQKRSPSNKVEKIGKSFKILTEKSSFFVVESNEKKLTDQPQKLQIPSQITRDWHNTYTYNHTASSPLSFFKVSPPQSPPSSYPKAPPSPPKKAKSPSSSSKAPTPIQKAKEVEVGLSLVCQCKCRLNCPRSGSYRCPRCGIFFKIQQNKEIIFHKRAPRTSPPEEYQLDLPWHFSLLVSQNAVGYFKDIKIVAKQLKISVKKLKKLANRLDNVENSDKIKVLTTFLAIQVLRADPNIQDISSKAIKKAELWLAKYPSLLTIDGVSIIDVMAL